MDSRRGERKKAETTLKGGSNSEAALATTISKPSIKAEESKK